MAQIYISRRFLATTIGWSNNPGGALSPAFWLAGGLVATSTPGRQDFRSARATIATSRYNGGVLARDTTASFHGVTGLLD